MALNLGQITFGLAANTQGLGVALRNVQNFGSRVANTVKASRGEIDGGIRQLIRQEQTMIRSLQSLQNQISKINAMNISPQVKTDAIKQLERAYTDLVKRMNTRADRPLNMLDFGRATLGFREQTDAVNRWTRGLHNATRGSQDFIGAMRGVGSGIELAMGPLNGFVFRIRAATELMSRYGVVAGATAGATIGLGTAIFGLGSEIIRASMEFQRANIMLTAVSGNSAVAGVQMQYVRDVSMQAGLAFSQTAKDFARYSAAATAAGQTTSEVRKQFQQMAMISGTLQLAQQDVSGVMKALEQIMSKGTVQSEELRGQLGDRMPAAFAIAAKAVGKTTRELSDMLKKGEVISKDFVPAFLEAAVKFYNIDLSKPIDSLQASLSRLQSRWDLFLVALDNATGASRFFKDVVDAMGRGLQYLTTNIHQVVGVVGALTGAMAGLLAVTAVTAVWGPLTTGIRTFASAMMLARTATELLTAAQIALNVVMTKLPVGRILLLLAQLALAIGGAILGYRMFSEAAMRASASMADTSSITSYIRAQKELGYNIRSTTNDLIQQQNVLAQTTRTQMLGKWNEMQSLLGRAGNLQAAIDGAIPGQDVAGFAAELSRVQKKANELAPELMTLAKNTKTYAQSVKDLGTLMKLPEQPTQDLSGGGGKGKPDKTGKTPDPERGLESIRDMILEARKAKEMLDLLFAGPTQTKLIEDIYKVKDATDKLDPDQIAQMRKYLDMPNATLQEMQQALVKMVTAGRQARDTAQEFAQAWEGLDQAAIDMKNVRAQFEYLAKGGDPDKMYMVEAFAKAAEAVKNFKELGPAGEAALEGLRKRLIEMGFSAATTEEALAKLYQTMADGQDQLGRFTRASKDLDDDLRTLGAQARILAGMKGASLGQILDLERLEDAREALYGLSEESLAQLSRRLNEAGIAGTDAVAQWAQMQKVIELNQKTIERHKQLLEDNRQAWVSLGDSAVDTLYNILDGTKSLKEGLGDLLKDMGKVFFEVGISNPFKSWIGGLANGTAGLPGFLGGKQNDPSQATTQQIQQLGGAAGIASRILGLNMTQAAGQNVASLLSLHGSQTAQVVAMGQATSSLMLLSAAAQSAAAGLGMSGGGGGWLSKAFNIVSSVISPGLDVRNIDQFVPGLTKAPNIQFPRAAGGPLMRGVAYRINEQGTNGDIFVPGQSGWANPKSHLTSSATEVKIDASIGYIDARGATPDAVAMLEQKLLMREQRLRQELPAIVDARVADSSWRGR